MLRFALLAPASEKPAVYFSTAAPVTRVKKPDSPDSTGNSSVKGAFLLVWQKPARV
ncbi:hypothetical protein [Cellvibrio polysaccharolyticus]|uniref:hypothetical protein n=1 Tax=Cellvibrio polysaccharolyticus TaxID=2082724 RepID=UPI001882C560|nr:hypothetical protein [Cellvibrio polysaccharolyticus]